MHQYLEWNSDAIYVLLNHIVFSSATKIWPEEITVFKKYLGVNK